MKVSIFVVYFVLHPDKPPKCVSGNERTAKSWANFFYFYNKKRKYLNNQTRDTLTRTHVKCMHTHTHMNIHARTYTHASRMHAGIYAQSSIRILNTTQNWVFSKAFRSIAHQTGYMETMLQ